MSLTENSFIDTASTYISSFLDKVKVFLTQPLFHIGTYPVTLSAFSRFLLIIILTLWFSRFIIKMLNRYAESRKELKKSVVYRMSRLIQYVIFVIGVLFALSFIGFDISNLFLLLSALGLGLGFGLQPIFNNFLSGLIILFESQLKVGDYVELESGVRGDIQEINVRSTNIGTNDGIDVLVPNSELINSKVINWTLKNPFRRIHIPFSVAYGSDKALIATVIAQAAKKIPHTLTDPSVSEPTVHLTKFGDHTLEMELVVWINEKYSRHIGNATSAYLWMIDDVLKENKIDVPFPQLEVRNMDALK